MISSVASLSMYDKEFESENLNPKLDSKFQNQKDNSIELASINTGLDTKVNEIYNQ